jgi:hypothetical protein
MAMTDSLKLYKPLSVSEIRSIEHSNWRFLVPDCKDQQWFYLKLNRGYAESIARLWNSKQQLPSFVVEICVNESFMQQFDVVSIAYEAQREYRLPVKRLDELNHHLEQPVRIISAYRHARTNRSPLHWLQHCQSFA